MKISPLLTAYLRHPVLPQDEQRELARRAQAGDRAARERLVRCSLRLCVHVAIRALPRLALRGYAVDDDEAMQLAMLGVSRAIDSYDPTKSSFSTYARQWIRAGVQAAVLDNRTVPLDERRPLRGFAHGGDALEEREYKRPELPDPSPRADEQMEERGHLASVTRITRRFTQDEVNAGRARDAMIFKLRYLAEKPLTLREIGACFGVSREAIRQNEVRVVDRFRRAARRSGAFG